MDFGKENHRGKVLFSTHHIKGIYYQYDLSLLMLTLITWLRECLSGFFTIKLLLFSLSALFSLEENHCPQPTLKEWEIMLSLLEDEACVNLFATVLDTKFIYVSNLLIIQSFTTVWTHKCLFYCLDYNPILL